MRECASKTGTGRIVMIITIRQLNPLLELLPPSAERTLYHGFYVVSPLSSGSAVALEIERGRALRDLFLCHPW